jgi:hypothetical protein
MKRESTQKFTMWNAPASASVPALDELLDPNRNPNRYSRELTAAATSFKPIREGVLRASQFPGTLTDAVGTITKPASW